MCFINSASRHKDVRGSRDIVRFTPLLLCPRVNRTGTHCIGDWVGPRAGLNVEEKRKASPLPEIEMQTSSP
jgi:hypothetical protein